MKIKTLIIMGLLSTAGSNLSAQDEKLTKEEIQELKEYFNWEQSTFKNPIINPQYNNSENLKAVDKKKPWEEQVSVPLDVYDKILSTVSLSTSSNEDDNHEIKVNLHYDFPSAWTNQNDFTGYQSGSYKYEEWPKNNGFDPAIGIQAERNDGVKIRFISRMTDNENKPMLLGNSLHYDRKPIRDDQGRQKGTDETYTLRTEQPLSQVKGDLSVCILQTEWKKVKITDADINKEFTLDGIPFELLSFKNGVIVIAFDYKYYDKVRDKWKYIGMKGGVWWKNNRAERSITSYTIYNNIINNPDYSFQDWMKHIDNEDSEHRAVCAFVSYAPIDEVYFYIDPKYCETILLEKVLKVK